MGGGADEESNCADTCPPPCYRRRVGNMFILYDDGYGTPCVVVGPCWAVGLCTFLAIGGIGGAVYGMRLDEYHDTAVWIGAICLLVGTAAAFLATCAADPGIFHGMSDNAPTDWVFSDQANAYRPPNRNIKWCREGGVLIEDLDHFCPWTGTVIAKKNLCAFQTFLCLLLVLLIFVCFILVMPPDGDDDDLIDDQSAQ